MRIEKRGGGSAAVKHCFHHHHHHLLCHHHLLLCHHHHHYSSLSPLPSIIRIEQGRKLLRKKHLKIAIYTTIHESFPASPSAVLIQHCHLVMKMLVKVTTDTICYNVNGGKMKERQGITCGRNLKIFVRLTKKTDLRAKF